MKNKKLFIRILMCFFGVMLCAVSVGIFKYAALGVDPFQSFMAGLDALVPLDFGFLYMLANAVLLIFSLIFDRHCIGIATFINLFLLGYVTQFSLNIFKSINPEPALWFRVLLIPLAIVLISLSISLYMTADLGISTYDAVALIITEKWKIGKFQYNRIITDGICIIIGITLFLSAGRPVREIPQIVGAVTVITALFMGPLISLFNEKISKPVLEKLSGEGKTGEKKPKDEQTEDGQPEESQPKEEQPEE